MMSQTVKHRFARRVVLIALSATLCWTPLTQGQESSLLHQTPRRAVATRAQAADGQATRGMRTASDRRPSGAPTASLGPPAREDLAARQGVYQGDPPDAPPAGQSLREASLAEVSWMYNAGLPPRQFQLNDIVTIRVDEIAQASAEGAAENRKNSLYDAVLKDWISLSRGFLKPAPQSDGDPRVNGQLNSLYRADASIESRESLTFNIAARIADIRPNGNLVVEAHKTIWVNDNAFETSLSGICRAEDIGPDNVLLSRDLLDPQIRKTERGRLRDGYRRGWFQRWFEEFQLF